MGTQYPSLPYCHFPPVKVRGKSKNFVNLYTMEANVSNICQLPRSTNFKVTLV